MYKLFISALALAIAFQCVESLPDDGSAPSCAKIQKQCSNEDDNIIYTLANPGKCVTYDCDFTPTKGYTSNPDKKFQLPFHQPQPKDSKRIIHSFKKYPTTVCAFRKQMCECTDPGNCKCGSKGEKFCQQEYRTERGYFLVFDKDDTPPVHQPHPAYYPPKPMHKPQHGYTKPSYETQHGYPVPDYSHNTHHYQNGPSHKPQHGHHTQGYPIYMPPHQEKPANNPENIYSVPLPIPKPTETPTPRPPYPHGDDMVNYYGNGQGGNQRSLLTGLLLGGLGNGASSLDSQSMLPMLSLLNKDDGEEGDGKSNIMNIFLMTQMMKNRQQQQGYDSGHGPHGPQYENSHPQSPFGGSFDPKILMYILTQKQGGSSKETLLKLLPYLFGQNQGRLKMEILYVKIPDGCSCQEDQMSGFNPLLKYLMFQKPDIFGFGGPSSPYDPNPSLPHFPIPPPEDDTPFGGLWPY